MIFSKLQALAIAGAMAEKRIFPSFLVYQDEQSRWRWTYAVAVGKEVAAGCASYGSRQACVSAIRELQQSAGHPVFAFQADTAIAKTAATTGDAPLLDLEPSKKGG
jgi:uncharacterized protein YegP (UPF0339 family)